MAKRRKLEMPDPAELEADLAPPPPGAGGMAPIAQIAGDTARSAHAPLTPDGQDAAAWREAEGQGRVIRTIDIERIDTGWIARDRARLDPGEMEELTGSIRANGLRMPVEVVPLEEGRFGLISGHRRILALTAIGEAAVPALVRRRPDDLAQSYAGMVEENEVRSALTQYERGRIAVIAAGQGAYPTARDAVKGLFPQASKAKLSKIGGFAAIHEELGDLLQHGPALTEGLGLRLAKAIKEGQGPRLRAALEEGAPRTAAREASLLDAALKAPQEDGPGGRTARGEPLAPGLRVVRGRHEMKILHQGIGAQGERELFELVRYWAEKRAERRGERRIDVPGWSGDGRD